MATSIVKNPNYAFTMKGHTMNRSGVQAFGWITTSGTDAVICFFPDRAMVGATGFTITSLTTSMRACNRNYLGGNASYNPLNDSTVSVHDIQVRNDGGVLEITLRKSSSWGFTNNTAMFGTINVNLTIT